MPRSVSSSILIRESHGGREPDFGLAGAAGWPDNDDVQIVLVEGVTRPTDETGERGAA
jgi:hypothetical protein